MMASEDTGKPAHNIDSCDTECASPHFTRASEDTGKPAHNIDSCDTEGAPEDAGRPAPNIDSGETECKRLVIPTEKGRQYFADSCETYKRKLNDLVSHLDTYARLTSETITAWPRLQKVETSQRLSEIFSRFQNLSDEYLNFLARHNTEESALEQSHHSYLRKTYADRVSTYTLLLSVRDNDRVSQGSVCSGKSRSKSCRSTGSAASVSTLVDKRMKAEAARARLQFIRRETELQCSAAAIQANMNELAAYKEVAVAEAELSVINDEVSDTRTHFSDTNTHFSSSPHQTYIKPRHSTPGDAAPPTQLPLYSDIPASEVTRPGLVGSPVAQQFVPASCVEQVMHQSHSVPVPPIDNSDISGTQVTQLIRQGVVSNPASLQFVPGFHVDQVLHQSQHASVAPVDRANIFVPQMTPLIRPGVVSNPVSQQFVPISHEKHAVHPSHDAPVPLVNKEQALPSISELPGVTEVHIQHAPVSSQGHGQPLPSISELPGVTGVHTQHAPVSPQGHGQPFPSVGGLIGASGDQSQHVLYDFTRLLLKRDLVTKMEAFDDKPEHFATWKAGFHRTVYELGVTPPEEQDLLVKWLGPSSSGEARSIRSSHAHDPVAGCRAIWARLEERYGAPEKVEASIKQKLEALGTVGNQDPEALYRLVDILGEIEAFKTNPLYRNLLAYYDSSSGVSPIVTKLPYNLQDKWTTRAFQYKQRHQVPYPPFSFFANFVREMSSMRNDPSLVNEQSKSRSFRQQPAQPRRNLGSTKKTDVAVTQAEPSVGRQNDLEHNCPIHNSSHSLNECIKFKKMPLDKRREYLRLNGICFKCCISKDHQARSCTMWKPCSACQSTRHPSAMHLQKNEERHNAPQEPPTDAAAEHGGEGPATKVSAKCTRLCGVISGGRSCSKVVLVQVYPAGCPEDAVSVYAILDDQSNHTLAQPELLDQLGVESPPMPYTLSSCAGVTETAGRMASGFTVAAMDGSVSHALPVMVECSDIPGNTQEIPTSEVAQAHPHLSRIADQLYPLQQVGIELLIGRDLLEAHHVHDQIVGPRDTPFAQKLSLGWVIVGDVCLEGRHRPSVTVMKTHVQSDGRGTIFESCGSTLHIEVLSPSASRDQLQHSTQEDSIPDFNLIAPDDDPDVRPEAVVKKSDVSISLTPLLERFEKFSTWKSLTSALSTLRHVAAAHGKSQNVPNTCHGWHQCEEAGKLFKRATEEFLIRHIQHQAFPRECAALGSGKDIPRDSSILSLSPYLDDMGLLRVGGRLNNLRESLGISSVNPVMVPKGHVALLLARFFHEKTSHQGRGLTEGMIRSNGYWIVGAKRLIMRVIYDCVMCRKLRRKPEEQKMADLPLDRLTPGPPFTGVGVDVFGPWSVVTRKTRGGAAQSKRWAVLFSCLTTRAVHIELIEDMSSSCFINALRRLVALRGPVKIYRSDRGTNFVGAADDIGVHVVNVEEGPVKSHLKENTATWIFNAPHASHMGGVWERAIGVARRILDSMLLKEGQKDLTHEVISTLMCEVCAIMNSRPVAVLDSDPSDSLVLSPSMLLTQKQGDTATLTEGLSQKDMYKSQWKHVQVLSDIFWKKWREGYLQALQTRRKWNQNRKNLKNGDFILLRDKICHRNDWSTAVVEKTLPSDDGLVRKATVRMIRDGVVVRYTRPVSEMVLLLD